MGAATVSVTVYIVNAPHRFCYAQRSLLSQPCEIIVSSQKWERSWHNSKMLVQEYAKAAENCETEWLLITQGDIEFPPGYLLRGLKSGADVYGCSVYHEKRCNVIRGQKRDAQVLQYSYAGEDCVVYPEDAALIRTFLAKRFSWTATCDLPAPAPIDHLYPFMQWAEKQDAKIVVDESLVAFHHKE